MNTSPGQNRKVVHVTGSLWKMGGGVSQVVWQLAERQVAMDFPVVVAGLKDDNSPAEEGVQNGVPYFAARGPRSASKMLYVRGLKRWLKNHEESFGLVHSHGLWEYPSCVASALARRRNIPLLISTHGMLEPWGLGRHRWRKRLFGLLFQNRNLRTAACMHATAQQEADNVRALGIDKPIAIVPIGLETDPYTSADPAEAREQWPEFRDKRLAVFMSRIHPKKGLLNMIEVWKELAGQFDDWQLVIAGPDELGHEGQVKAAAKSAGIGDRVTFVGPVYGTLKTSLLTASDLFVLPTFSENFGIVVLESLAAGAPVITTKGAPWKSIEDAKCGWWIETGVPPLMEAMRDALSMPESELQAMGQRGLGLVKEQYSWPHIGRQMVAVYDWLLGLGDRPDCVISG